MYDLLIVINTIKELGGVQINPSGAVEFCCSKSSFCTAITINEFDFSSKFDYQLRCGLQCGNG